MYLNILKYLFMFLGAMLFLLLLFRPLIVSKIQNNLVKSDFVSFIAGVLLCYVVLALILALFLNGIIPKIIMLFFAVSPFIIGKMATYEKEKTYSFLQNMLALVSVVCIYLF